MLGGGAVLSLRFCLFPIENSSHTICRCIEPCTHQLYQPVLSYSALTDQVIQELLGPNAALLEQNYNTALDTNDRVTQVSLDTSDRVTQVSLDTNDRVTQVSLE